MPHNIPSGTITGRNGWEWNRLQRSRDTEGGSADEGPSSRAPDCSGPETGREQADPEAQLRRMEHRLQCIVDQYERLLAERNRELARRAQSGSDARPLESLSDPVAYLSEELSFRSDSSSSRRL